MMMSNYGGQRLLVVDCCYCQTQIPLPSVSPISVRCGRCYASTRVASPGFPRSPYSAVPYYVLINPPPHACFPYRSPGPPPNVHRQKKAVICGISYRYSSHELKGSINDAIRMRHLLISKFKFPEDSIVMLTGVIFWCVISFKICLHLQTEKLPNNLSPSSMKLSFSGNQMTQKNYISGHLKENTCKFVWMRKQPLVKCIYYSYFLTFILLILYIFCTAEEETDPYKIPYKSNIKGALRWLVQGCQPGDSLLFYFSGHGSQLREQYRGDELDGYDETLCPLDVETQGMIRDDWINATIVRPIPYRVKLHAIIDSCNSGTMLDLPWLCRMDWGGNYTWDKASGVWKGTSGGEVICISGCDDHQTSAETQSIPTTGVMTSCFIQAIKSGQAATYGSLLYFMRNSIRSGGGGGGSGSGGAVTSLAGMLLAGGSVGGGGLTQEPQLTACDPFDVYTKPFAL
ncbi:putative Caspase-like domain-containing protein [Rosa chinensis]|uniref:Putative Caspase-like domain-containing protein n=1 Tax=Rosa chinensis TaxID=74649 RepID=A0A2P6SEJ5_ROSCH|nr:putative Caspase-like domain-containing protein [Rosa chinensis]